MYTQCPHCHAAFRVSAVQLRAASGQVRCGGCQEVFNALPHLSDDPPPIRPPTRDVPPAPATPPPVTPRPDEVLFGPELERAPAPPRNTRLKVRVGTAVAVLVALLIAGIGYTQRAELARYPELRPGVEALCTLFGCKLPLLRDVKHIRLTDRLVGAHPSLPGALEIRLSFINDAPHPQPYPVVHMRLFDANGQLVREDRFPPSTYIQGDGTALGMAPGQIAHITLNVTDPGTAAQNFELDFE